MPKKFKGENSKASEARARKAAVQHETEARKQAAKEDEYWRDDDKHTNRKQQRKEGKEQKRVDQVEKKKELQKLHDEEMASIKSAKPAPVAKVTRHQLDMAKEQRVKKVTAENEADSSVTEVPLEENVNRMVVDGVEARSVTDAISVLSLKDKPTEIDRHPEKRVKAAYAAYEEVNLPRLKAENSNMRLSQIKQMLRKDWMKSPENPLNQRLQAAHNAAKS